VIRPCRWLFAFVIWLWADDFWWNSAVLITNAICLSTL
jgi:hypothetical protein